ncbi:MAG TPA: hypothetical protein VEY50_07180 [Lysobacter sp.]|nr:hypothetical protein [Lysobacter sp.]
MPTRLAALLAALLAAGCSATPQRAAPPQDAFFAHLRALCGQAFAGRVVEDTPAPAGSDPFAAPLLMHVRECEADTLRIPFHVGEDRSRTWVLTRTAGGLRLKHDHRHADGRPDELTMYGGDTREPGSASRQTFPADPDSVALFRRTGREVSVTNVWALEIEPGRRFVYELTRPGRRFRVEFDLSRPVAPPPAPWGAQ